MEENADLKKKIEDMEGQIEVSGERDEMRQKQEEMRMLIEMMQSKGREEQLQKKELEDIIEQMQQEVISCAFTRLVD